MSDLFYSDEALNVKAAFFRAKAIIYVEGDDDLLFWKEIFDRVTDEPFEVESVGGSVSLDEYIAKIIAGDIDAIAARDADLMSVTGAGSSDPKIVYTHGYSIENSLYVEGAIAQLVRSWAKSPQVTIEECTAWLRGLARAIEPLVHLDAANAIAIAGVATIGDNCTRYMTSAKSATVCPNKIAAAAAEIQAKIPAVALQQAQAIVGSEPNEIISNLRGHFLTSAVHRYVVKRSKDFGRKVSISAESLYAAAIAHFISALDTNHPHREHYLASAQAAWQAV